MWWTADRCGYTISKSGYFTHSDSFNVTQADNRTILLQRTGEPIDDCNISLSPQSILIGSAATTAGFTVSAPAGCAWTAASTQPFLQIISGQSGVGNGSVEYSITDNETGGQREATVIVNNATHQVIQRTVADPVDIPGADFHSEIRWNRGTNLIEFIGSTRNSIIPSAYQTVAAWPGMVCPCQMWWESWVDAWLGLQAPDGSLVAEHYEWSWIIAQHPQRFRAQPMLGEWRLNSQHRLLRDYYFVVFDPEQGGEQKVYAGTLADDEWGGFDISRSIPVSVQPTAQLRLFLDVDGNFNPVSPVANQDDAPRYLPGATLDGTSVPVFPQPQLLRLIAVYTTADGRIVAPPSHSPVSFSLSDTSAYLGFAMNAGTSTAPDYSLVSTDGQLWL